MPSLQDLISFFEKGSLIVLTGAGMNEASGMPTYPDYRGNGSVAAQ